MTTREDRVFPSVTLDGLEDVAKEIVGMLGTYKVWLFRGEMGSGKTTLIKKVGAA